MQRLDHHWSGATTVRSRGDHALTLHHPRSRRDDALAFDDALRTAPPRRRGSTTTALGLDHYAGRDGGGATTTVGWVTIYCGVSGPNGGAGTA